MTNPSEAVERVIADLRLVHGDMTPSQLERCDSDGHAQRIDAAIKLIEALSDHPPQAEGEALGSSPDGDTHRAPEEAVLAPSPPWPMGGGENNSRRAGWLAFFEGKPRTAAFFPIARPDLRKGFVIGWDAAQQAAPASDTTAGYGVDAIGVVDQANPAPQQVAKGDQVDVWAQRLYESNAFYALSHADPDECWTSMAPNDAGIRDLHMDMARAAKDVWDNANAPQQGVEGVRVSSPLERERFVSIVGERLDAAFWAGSEMSQTFDSAKEAEAILATLRPSPDSGGLQTIEGLSDRLSALSSRPKP